MFVVPLLAVFCTGGVGAADECIRCHQVATPKIAAEHATSVHAAGEVECVDCHGGDPKGATKDAGHSKEKSYRGTIPREEIPAHCASCHGDVNRMKFTRLDTNVLGEWKMSRHGKLYGEGDARAAGCTQCHGTHAILAGRDPKSRTNRQNVPSTCGECHSHPEKMAPAKVPTDQEAQYLSGVHGEILKGKRPGNADLVPTCVDCHGVHGAAPPEAQTVPAVCGSCHFEERRYLAMSPHHTALRLTGAPSCVTCHGNHHNTVPPSGSLVDENCRTCHKSDGDQGIVAAKKLVGLMARAREALELSERVLAEGAAGLSEKTRLLVRGEHERVRRAFHQARSESHALDLVSLERSVGQLAGIVKTTEAVVTKDPEAYAGFSRSTVTLIVASLGLIICAASVGLAWLLLKIYRRLPARSSQGG